MYAALPADVDIHSIASVMKQFFRELPDALIPASYQAEFIGAARTSVSDIHGIDNFQLNLLRTNIKDELSYIRSSTTCQMQITLRYVT